MSLPRERERGRQQAECSYTRSCTTLTPPLSQISRHRRRLFSYRGIAAAPGERDRLARPAVDRAESSLVSHGAEEIEGVLVPRDSRGGVDASRKRRGLPVARSSADHFASCFSIPRRRRLTSLHRRVLSARRGMRATSPRPRCHRP